MLTFYITEIFSSTQKRFWTFSCRYVNEPFLHTKKKPFRYARNFYFIVGIPACFTIIGKRAKVVIVIVFGIPQIGHRATANRAQGPSRPARRLLDGKSRKERSSHCEMALECHAGSAD